MQVLLVTTGVLLEIIGALLRITGVLLEIIGALLEIIEVLYAKIGVSWDSIRIQRIKLEFTQTVTLTTPALKKLLRLRIITRLKWSLMIELGQGSSSKFQ